VFLNGEVVVDYALRLKRDFDPARLWVTSYAGYVPCYIPSRRILNEGGYEAEDSLWYYDRPARLAPAAEDLIVQTVAELVPKSYALETKKAEAPEAKSSAESLACLRTRAELAVELVVAEPLVQSPVAIDWGADGRLWVCEMFDYPTGLDGNYKPGGRIKVLSDADNDGRYDQATVFVDGLAFPTGVTPWGRGAFICAAPDILFAEDTDGDGRADVVRTNCTGFATHNYQARVNGFAWGLDGWLHGSGGLFGGKIRNLVAGGEVDLSGRDFRLQPETGAIEAVAGLSQMGRVRDDMDHWFGNDNSTLLWHYPLPERYTRRNPNVSYPNPRVLVAAGDDPNRLNPRSRTLERFNDPHAANRVTAACGPEIYRDDLLGSNYYGNAFVCEPVHNLVRRMVLAPSGVTFSGQRAADETSTEFLASTDNWFRPVQGAHGTRRSALDRGHVPVCDRASALDSHQPSRATRCARGRGPGPDLSRGSARRGAAAHTGPHPPAPRRAGHGLEHAQRSDA
jgi:putative membrane-bound dehydrogenase-like protein